MATLLVQPGQQVVGVNKKNNVAVMGVVSSVTATCITVDFFSSDQTGWNGNCRYVNWGEEPQGESLKFVQMTVAGSWESRVLPFFDEDENDAGLFGVIPLTLEVFCPQRMY